MLGRGARSQGTDNHRADGVDADPGPSPFLSRLASRRTQGTLDLGKSGLGGAAPGGEAIVRSPEIAHPDVAQFRFDQDLCSGHRHAERGLVRQNDLARAQENLV